MKRLLKIFYLHCRSTQLSSNSGGVSRPRQIDGNRLPLVYHYFRSQFDPIGVFRRRNCAGQLFSIRRSDGYARESNLAPFRTERDATQFDAAVAAFNLAP